MEPPKKRAKLEVPTLNLHKKAKLKVLIWMSTGNLKETDVNVCLMLTSECSDVHMMSALCWKNEQIEPCAISGKENYMIVASNINDLSPPFCPHYGWQNGPISPKMGNIRPKRGKTGGRG